MSMRKIVNKETGVDPVDYVGEFGEAWMSDNDTLIRMGDGQTPGGVPLNNRLQNGAFTAPMNADGSISIPGTITTTGTMTLTGNGVDYTTYIGTWTDDIDESNLTTRAVSYDSQGNAYVLMHYQYPGFGIYKLDPAGNQIWSQYLTGYNVYGYGMAIDHHDNPVLVGTNSGDIGVIKLNGINGSINWSIKFSDYSETSHAGAVACDSSGDIFVAGWFYNNTTELTEFLTVKIHGQDGKILWSKGYNSDMNTNFAFTMVVDNDGDVVVGGNQLVPDYSYITFFKLKGVDGSLVWSKDIYDPSVFGMDTTYGLYIGGASVDSAGSIYFNSAWALGGPVGVSLLTKLNKDGVFQWARSSDTPGYVPWAASTAVDNENNVYCLSNYWQAENNTSDYPNWDPNYHYNRLVYSVVKFDTSGKTLWQRFLTNRQHMILQLEGDITMFPSSGGTLIDVNDKYLLIGGINYQTNQYSTSQEYFQNSFVLQIPRDGLPFSHDGWEFMDSALTIQGFETPTLPASTFVFENVTLGTGSPLVTYSQDNADIYVRNSLQEMPSQSIVIDGNGINMDRPTVGTFTTYGNFDGSEGGNVWGNTYFYGLARDSLGNVYVTGGDEYNGEEYLTKIDSAGKVQWSANINNMSICAALAVDPSTQLPTLISLDGGEGFNISAMNAAGTSLETTHIQGSLQNYYGPSSAVINSQGETVVVGQLSWGTTTYTDCVAGTPQSAVDVLVVAKNKFTAGDYPDYISDWQIKVGSDYYDIIDINNWYDLASTTNSQHGNGSTWNIYIDPDKTVYKVDLGNSGGALYRVGDQIYISGDLVLGDATANKITITVTAVDSGGSITGWSAPVGVPQTEWIKLSINSGGTVNFSTGGPFTVVQNTGSTAVIYTPNWGRVVGTHNSTDDYFNTVAVDSNDNIIVGGYLGSLGENTGIVMKFNPSGDVVWKNLVDQNSNTHQEVNGVRVDSRGDVVVFHTPYDDSVYVTKMSGETGDILWSAQIGDGQFSNEPYDGISVDEEGYIYVGGVYYASSECYNDSFLVVKIDPNGGLVYMRDVYSTFDLYNDWGGSNYQHDSISVSNGMMSLCFGYSYVPGDNYYQATVATLPADGSGHGTYGPWIYREIEYPYAHNLGGTNAPPADAVAEEHLFIVEPYEPPAVSEFWIMQDKLTGVMKQATGGQVSLAQIVFEDGSVMDTSGQDVPQVDQTKTDFSDYLLQLDDRGKHIYKWTGNVIVPTNDEIPFPVGSTITIVTDSATIYLYADNNSTTRIRGIGADSSSSSYSIAAYSMVTLLKVQKDIWMLSGGTFTTY